MIFIAEWFLGRGSHLSDLIGRDATRQRHGFRGTAASVGSAMRYATGMPTIERRSRMPPRLVRPPIQYVPDHLQDKLIGIAPASLPEKLDRRLRVADERPQHPGHLDADEYVDDDPGPQHPAMLGLASISGM